MDKQIFKTLSYFQFFQYAPSIGELHKYTEKKIGESELKNHLDKLVKQRNIKKHYVDSTARYTLGGYGIPRDRIKNSKIKIRRIKNYLNIIKLFPQIHLVGLSGSVAMMNAEKTDDIDLFIISAPNRIWTARFLAVVTARILGNGRKRSERRGEYGDKVCLNLFFDGQNLSLPKKKRTLYGAHEALQMKPLIDKQNVYNRFLWANKWVFRIFPNAERVSSLAKLGQDDTRGIIGNILEVILKHLQLFLIRRHQTTELISETQLWFHPDDYEEKIGNHLGF